MPATDEIFMGYAIKKAELSRERGYLPVGTVIVRDLHEIVAKGSKTGLLHSHFDHTERNACEELLSKNFETLKQCARGLTVYTTLEPCLMCLGLMMHLHVSRIVYGLENPYGGGVNLLWPDVFLLHKHDRPVITSGIYRERIRIIMREFFETGTRHYPWDNPENPLIKLCVAA